MTKHLKVDNDTQIHLTIEHNRNTKKPKHTFAVVARNILISASLIASLAITGFAQPVYATPTPTAVTQVATTSDSSLTRLAGNTRYETAVAIAKDGWTQSDYAILAYGENYPDALAASPLAYQYNAPILLTESGKLTDVTKQALQSLKVKTVFIVGGTGVISENVANSLKSMSIAVERLAGNSRYDTSAAIANKLGNLDTVFVATGDSYPDALSVAAIAGKLGMPILLVQKDAIPENVQTYLATHTITKSYIVGGYGVISDTVLARLPNPERLAGNDRYDTNIAILKNFEATLSKDKLAVATGEGFADALTGAAHAAKNATPVLLLPPTFKQTTQDYLSQKAPTKTTIFGGTFVVPTQRLTSYLNAPTPATEATLASNLDIASKFLQSLTNQGTMSPTALNNLAKRLTEIESRLNNNLTYGSTLINSIKLADTTLSSVDMTAPTHQKTPDTVQAYTITKTILDRVKTIVNLPTTPTPAQPTTPITGTTVWVGDTTSHGLKASLTPIPGYQQINVRFGAHSYGAESMEQYNKVMEAADYTKKQTDKKIRDSIEYGRVQEYKKGTADERTSRWVTNSYPKSILTASDAELIRYLSARSAAGAIVDYAGPILTNDGPSAYDTIYSHDASCLGLGFSQQIAFDMYNFNTRVIGNDGHAWVEVEIAGVWYDILSPNPSPGARYTISEPTTSNQP